MKTYSLCVCRGYEKDFEEMTILEVVVFAMNFVSSKVLFAKPKNKLRISFPIYITNHKKKLKNWNVLEFRQQICLWNVLTVLGYWENEPPAIQFPDKFESILC